MINKENDKSCFFLDRNRNLEIVNYSKPVLAMNTDPLVQAQGLVTIFIFFPSTLKTIRVLGKK